MSDHATPVAVDLRRHNHVTRDVKPIGECDGCDTPARLRREIERLRAERITVSISREVPPGSAPLSAKARVMSGLNEEAVVRLTSQNESWEFRSARFTIRRPLPPAWLSSPANDRLAALLADLRDAEAASVNGMVARSWLAAVIARYAEATP